MLDIFFLILKNREQVSCAALWHGGAAAQAEQGCECRAASAFMRNSVPTCNCTAEATTAATSGAAWLVKSPWNCEFRAFECSGLDDSIRHMRGECHHLHNCNDFFFFLGMWQESHGLGHAVWSVCPVIWNPRFRYQQCQVSVFLGEDTLAVLSNVLILFLKSDLIQVM